jgi:phage baseplate assembly protein gpV
VKAGANVKVKAPQVKIKAPSIKVKGEAKASGRLKIGN